MPFSAEAADKACRFFEEFLVHVEGEWAGQPFLLMPWQRDRVIRPLFGTLNLDGNRQYRTCYIEVPRKNGKSPLAAGIALYLLCADHEPGAQVYGAASHRDQAAIVYRVASEMVKRSSDLSNRLKIFNSTKRIIHERSASFYRAIPAEAAGSHGFGAHGIIVDEVHVQPSRDLIDVLVTSTGARRQPLTFLITTAGFDRNSICYEYHDYALKVQSGIIVDPTFLPVVYAAAETDDWEDPHVWAKANPSLGVTISLDYLKAEYKKAVEVVAYQNTFKRLYLNIWTTQDTRWLDIAAWDRCADPVDLPSLHGRTCYAALDLASTTDIAALTLVFPSDDEAPPTEDEQPQSLEDEIDGESEPPATDRTIYDVLAFFWVPSENVTARVRRDRVPYDVWIRDGLITATEGNVIHYAAIRQKLDELAREYDIVELGFDRWGATQLTQELQEAGMEVVPIGQGFASMSAPTKELLNLVLSRRLRHGGNPVLRWMADNLRVSQDAAGNLKPDKAKSSQRIDGIVSLVMSIDRATRHAGSGKSTYETHGLLVL